MLEEVHTRGWIAWTDAEQVTLTEAGRAAWAELGQQVVQARAELTAGISPEEYATTIDVLHRIAVNLGWTGSS